MVYIALLRGINVGGHNLIDMKALKHMFEALDFKAVVTYINSGNVLFRDDIRSQREITTVLEHGIEKTFGFAIKVLVVSEAQMDQVMATLPEHWQNNTEMKSDVMFLWENISEALIEETLIIKPEIDNVIKTDVAILWMVTRENQSKSGMNKIVSTKLYKQMTVRNVNTTRKLYDLMKHPKGGQ